MPVWFRNADRRWPFLWEEASQPPARWHGPSEGPAQYLADTPDGETRSLFLSDGEHTREPHKRCIRRWLIRWRPTELDATLKKLGATQLVVTGCTTSICVESTVRDAMFRDYQCVLLRDCMAEPIGNNLPRSNHEASLLSIEVLFGWTASSDDFIGGLTGESSK